MRSFTLVSIVGLALTSGAVYANGLADNPETRLPYSLFGQVYPPSLGEESIAIFRDIHKEGGGESPRRTRYYVQPYFKPDFQQLESNVEVACEGKEDSERVEVGLNIEISSRAVNREIVDLLNKELPDNERIKLGQLQPYPYASLTVVAGARRADEKSPSWQVFRHPVSAADLGENSGLNSVTVSFRTQLSETPISISETCARLSKVAKERDLSAYILTRYSRLKQNSLNVNYSAFFESQAYRDIFREERAEGNVRTVENSRGGGLGLNIWGGFIGIDDQEVEVTASDTRRRFVSGDVINRAAARFANSVQVAAVSENPDRLLSIDEIISKTEAIALRFAEPVKAEFTRLANGSYTLSVGSIERTLTEKEMKSLLEASAAPNVEASEKTKIVLNDTTVDSEVDGSYKDDRKVKWDYTDSGWVPTSVDLYMVEDTKVSGAGSFGLSDVGVVSASGYQLIALTTILREGELPPAEPIYLAHEPYKHVIEVPAGPVSTTVYVGTTGSTVYSGLASFGQVASFECAAAVDLPSGFLKVGSEYEMVSSGTAEANNSYNYYVVQGKEFLDTLRVSESEHCIVSQICSQLRKASRNESGKFCVSRVRSSGCYVNREWLQWYEERERRLPDTVKTGSDRIAEICASEYISR